MTTQLRVLIVEDSEDDTQLILHRLRSGAYDPRWERVDTPEAMTDSLNREQWDVILCDYKMPRFSAPAALKLVQEREIDIPFIVVSGTIGEETAVAMMKAGAHDFLMKDNLARLIVAIEREIHEARIRIEKKRTEEALRIKDWAIESALNAIAISDLSGNMTYVNPAFLKLWGYSSPAEVLGKPAVGFWQIGEKAAEVIETLRTRGGWSGDLVALRKDGALFKVSLAASMVLDASSSPICMMASFVDITERKRAEEERHQAEENFRRSMDESPLGIRIMSAEGETLYANQAILSLYGYKDIEELISTSIKNRYTPESYSEHQSRKEKRMNKEDCSSEYELSIIKKTGEIRRLRVLRKDVLWNGQKKFQAIYQDITEQKKTEGKLRETLVGLRNALSGIVRVLSTTIEKRDPYTAGHQRRVADLARAIGEEMGLDAERVEGLRIAGTIHDVGKVSIPAEILSKPDRLTDIEMMLIKSHPQVGYDILNGIEFSWPIAEMVLQHHERMNGSGYPLQLKGKDLLLGARILAVSDVVEAMASHRPYRPALGIEAALEEIDGNKGVLYDSDVVAACLKLFREKGFLLKAGHDSKNSNFTSYNGLVDSGQKESKF